MSEAGRIEWITLGDAERSRLRAAAAGLARHPWVRAVYLYGSAAGGGPARDVDLGVVARPIPTEMGVEATLASELAAASGLPVARLDVRIVNAADPVFLGSLLSRSTLLFQADADERAAFESAAMSRWLDFKPAWQRVRALVLGRWAGE